jgi:GNAT superfamily N-acetyltransferase
LEAPSRRDAELNEARWWSSWARLSWSGDAYYTLESKRFKESFFNRAVALSCGGVAAAASRAEEGLGARGLPSAVTVFDSCDRGIRDLLASGYRAADTMTVLVSRGAIPDAHGRELAVRSSSSAGSWVRAYLDAFYGERALGAAVVPIARRLLKARAATLLEARVEGRLAGVLALFRTKGVAGVYCLGTVPEFRGEGVATGLLAKSKEIAGAEGRHLILQTLASDGAGPFYSQRGFRRLYSKKMMEKES